jgi:hypothetical protein
VASLVVRNVTLVVTACVITGPVSWSFLALQRLFDYLPTPHLLADIVHGVGYPFTAPIPDITLTSIFPLELRYFTVPSLVPGLALDSAKGILSGTMEIPLAVQNYSIYAVDLFSNTTILLGSVSIEILPCYAPESCSGHGYCVGNGTWYV